MRPRTLRPQSRAFSAEAREIKTRAAQEGWNQRRKEGGALLEDRAERNLLGKAEEPQGTVISSSLLPALGYPKLIAPEKT